MEQELAKKAKTLSLPRLGKSSLTVGKLLILLILFCLLGQSRAFADGGSVTATVRINPLVVTVSVPSSVTVGEHFNVKVTIENHGESKIKRVVATIDLPDGLSLGKSKAEKIMGAIPPYKEKTVRWRVSAEKEGTYVILVSASGEDEPTGTLLTAEGSTTIEVAEGSSWGSGRAILSVILGIFKLLFGG